MSQGPTGPEAERLAKLQLKLAKLPKQVKSGDMTAEEAQQEEARLGKKIKKLEKALASTSAAENGGSDGGDADKGQKKKKRKQQKAAAQEEGGDAGAGEEEEAPPSAKKPQKGKKGAKKSEEDDEANGVAGGGDEEEEANGHAAKKQKKQQPLHHAGQKHAEVGDVELAAAGRPVVKALYTEHADVTALSAARVAELRAERATTIEGFGPGDQIVPGSSGDIRPLTKFEQTGLPANMLHAVRDFVQPSPIQAQCWPIALSGRDLIGIAATGSGKTLGFGLPMLRHIAAQKEAGVVKGKGPFAVVMAPTRELAMQINEVLEESGSRCGVRTVCVYGGVPKGPQVSALKGGVEVVVGTPGRMEDLMGDGVTLTLKQVTYVVLDEADRMLDLGFEPHIRTIVSQTRADRQTLMFSATWPTAVQKMAAQFLCKPVKVTIGSHDLSASHSITQVIEVIEPFARDNRLLELLAKYHSSRKNRVLIFVLYKKEAPRVEQQLTRKGWKAVSVHGDISQAQRTEAVEKFKSGNVPLLIATDVAARGLDIPDVEVVINYSFPLTTEDYVHRIGRTGRAGKTGVAHTFFCAANDKPRAGELINVLREAKQDVPSELLKFGTAVKKKESKVYGAHFKDVDVHAKSTKISFDSDDDA